ncbi:hypothetical protein RclHR1_01420010 [Rhizophagus clarus]|uniref:MARVEL domain-containing protein n=1 Tax=Rhizophagus clarus TaxID=94130 RepID=A0A2Z6QBX5_9GLOM|nr:hypothetical protein RclHR1_01420010 [Rhizophagus clarus]GES95063.1 hypothetical protein GLOIN_2v1543694 [Rhizophagus clarus]
MSRKGFYLCLRVTQYLALLCIMALEITQLVLFKGYKDAISFGDSTSWKDWFENFYKKHGIKYFYYIVIIVTLIYLLYSLITFTHRWKTGPHKKVIFIEIFFLLLWLAVGFTNIYPIYFDDSTLNCDVNEEFKDIPGKLTECRAYLASMAVGWFMALLFLHTAIHTVYLWSHRDKIHSQPVQNGDKNDNNDSYPNPDNPVLWEPKYDRRAVHDDDVKILQIINAIDSCNIKQVYKIFQPVQNESLS